MNKNNLGAFVLAGLVVGLGVGYGIGVSHQPEVPAGAHRMPDGTVMGDGGMSMEDMMRDMNAALAGKDGDAFDQAFLAEMIVHHEGAVSMAELALEHAGKQELKDLARGIIAAQEGEIAQMKAWQQAWGTGEGR